MATPHSSLIEDLYTRICKVFSVTNRGDQSEEATILTHFWEALQTHLPQDIDAATVLPMLEEALVLRIVSCRLLNEISPLKGKDETPYKPNLEPWLKTQERLRKVMKDIMQHYGHIKDHDQSNNDVSLAEIMAPILKQGEGILEDALEFEARKKSTQKKRCQPKSN